MSVSQKLELFNVSDGSKVSKQCKTWKPHLKNQMTTHPVWFSKDDVPQYELPNQLQN
jgi:hypothetical protein